MTEQERINADVQRQLALQDAKFNQFMEEMKDFRNEMRDRDNQRHAEISAIRTETNALRAETNEQIAAIKNTVESIGKHVDNMALATVVGIGAMVLTVVFAVILR